MCEDGVSGVVEDVVRDEEGGDCGVLVLFFFNSGDEDVENEVMYLSMSLGELLIMFWRLSNGFDNVRYFIFCDISFSCVVSFFEERGGDRC